jgi:hypothetical protein
VVNSRTRVVHDEDICSAHLPAEKNRIALNKLGTEVCVHASVQGRILEDLARNELSILASILGEDESSKVTRSGRYLISIHKTAHAASGMSNIALSRDKGKNSRVELSKDERQARHKQMLDMAGRAVPYLVKAIELNPLGYHLYDKLIRVYGRLSRYQDIAKLLDGAQQAVARETAELNQQSPPTPVGERRLKQLERAKKEFEIRVAAVKRKEREAAMRKLRSGSSPK